MNNYFLTFWRNIVSKEYIYLLGSIKTNNKQGLLDVDNRDTLLLLKSSLSYFINSKILILIFLLHVALVPTHLASKEISSDSPENLIHSIYKNHSEKKSLDLCSSKISKDIFDKKLLQLILKDCKCRIKSGELCKLNYDPFIGGQDFLEPTIKPKINQINKKNYEVQIYESSPIQLNFEIISTKEGYRIRDIKKQDESLLNTLK